jgi:hypothetical protein
MPLERMAAIDSMRDLVLFVAELCGLNGASPAFV